MERWSFEAIGTTWRIEFDAEEAVCVHIRDTVSRRIEAFDAVYSRFRDDSLVTRMWQTPGTYTLPDDAQSMLALYEELYRATRGKFTPLIGTTMVDAGYDAQYSLIPKDTVSAPPTWEEAVTYVHPHITFHAPVLLDVGAAGKGYLVDIVAAILETAGVRQYVIDAGGDFRVRDAEGVEIGLEHPEDTTQAIGIARLIEGSLCGSSGNRRTWSTYTHIIDPDTQTSPELVRAAWAIAPTALVADAIATCLFLVEPETLATTGAEYLVVYADYTFKKSPGFPAELFIS